jgi:hypothetical protein
LQQNTSDQDAGDDADLHAGQILLQAEHNHAHKTTAIDAPITPISTVGPPASNTKACRNNTISKPSRQTLVKPSAIKPSNRPASLLNKRREERNFSQYDLEMEKVKKFGEQFLALRSMEGSKTAPAASNQE